jgi:hypothetical protein
VGGLEVFHADVCGTGCESVQLLVILQKRIKHFDTKTMNRIFFVIFLCIFLPIVGAGQGLRLGIGAEAGVWNLQGLPYSVVSYGGKAIVGYKGGGKLGLDLSLGYVQGGGTASYVEYGGTYQFYEEKSRLSLGYLQAGLVGRYSATEKLSIGFGPYFGVRSHAMRFVEQRWENPGTNGSDKYERDVSGVYNWNDWGLGLELRRSFGKGLYAELSIRQGLRDVYTLSKYDRKYFNQNFLVGVGWMILD